MSQPALESSGVRLPAGAIPEALRAHVVEVYEEAIPALPSGALPLSVSASVVAIYNATLRGHAEITLAPGGRFTMPPLLLSPPQPEPYVARCTGAVEGFYAVLRATAPLALLGVRRHWPGPPAPVPATPDLVRPDLAERTRAFESALRSAPDFAARGDLLLGFLMHALDTAPPADLADAAFLGEAVQEIERRGGQIRVDPLARMLGVSPSTLRRRFAVVGMPVKRFADIVRFRQAHAFLSQTPGATWTDAAYRFGYADQSHFVRAYRRFSGAPPTQWNPHAHAIDIRMGIEDEPVGGADA